MLQEPFEALLEVRHLGEHPRFDRRDREERREPDERADLEPLAAPVGVVQDVVEEFVLVVP